MSNFKPPNPNVLTRYAKFLDQVDVAAARQWGKLCNIDLEAATCEAFAWGLLSDLGLLVKPNSTTNSQGKKVDFQCEKDAKKFYVEVTCIKQDTMAKATGLSSGIPANSLAQVYSAPTNAIWRECCSKAKQCADWDSPVLLLIGTFHFQASCFFKPKEPIVDYLLTGETSISWHVNSSGQAIGDTFSSTSGESAAFLNSRMDSARKSISGLLLAGFGQIPVSYCGVLHHEAIRPFDRSLLPSVSFGESEVDKSNGSIKVSWC